MNASSDFIATTDPEGHLTFLNPAGRRMTGRDPAEDIRGTCLADYHTAAAAPQMAGVALPQAGRQGSWTGELVLRAKDGRDIPVLETIIAHKDSKGRVQGYSILARDNAQLKEAERKLQENEQSLRELSSYVLQSQEEERRRILRDLHDSTSQSLTGILARLHVVNKDGCGLDATTRKLLAESLKLAENTASLIRTLSCGLHPLVLDEQGLPAALRWYAESIAAPSKVQIEIDSSLALSRLPREAERSLYRIAQESITRIRLVSPKSAVRVRLVSTPEEFVLEVWDEDSRMPTAASASLLPAPCPRPDTATSPQPRAMGPTTPQSAVVADQETRTGTTLRTGMRAGDIGFGGMQERMRRLGGWLENSCGDAGNLVRAILPLGALPQAGRVGETSPAN